MDFVAAIGLERFHRPRWRRAILLASFTCSLGLLGFFKYFRLLRRERQGAGGGGRHHADAARAQGSAAGRDLVHAVQTLSYVIDVYRGELPATHDLIEITWPTSRSSRSWSRAPSSARATCCRSSRRRASSTPPPPAKGFAPWRWGFFKKMALADTLRAVADATFAQVGTTDAPDAGGGDHLLRLPDLLRLLRLLRHRGGMRAPVRRAAHAELCLPYFSQSVAEFWRRWHISLSTWFRDYVYVPLGGGREGMARRIRNVMITFVLSGLWHGASWNFVVWGALNGLASPAEPRAPAVRRGR